MSIDYKKAEREFYQPKTTPSIIDIPAMKFIAVDGKGDPNTSPEYAAAVQLLYGLSFTIKMTHKDVLQYVVPPLEGFWDVDDSFFGGGDAIADKSKLIWTSLIRQPDFVSPKVFETARSALAYKKPELDTGKARLIDFTEGLCVQVMHIGPYDDEPATVFAMDKFATANGYVLDIGGTTNTTSDHASDKLRRHHEIYLCDPRRCAPERLKTILRHPVRKA